MATDAAAADRFMVCVEVALGAATVVILDGVGVVCGKGGGGADIVRDIGMDDACMLLNVEAIPSGDGDGDAVIIFDDIRGGGGGIVVLLVGAACVPYDADADDDAL